MAVLLIVEVAEMMDVPSSRSSGVEFEFVPVLKPVPEPP